MRLLRDTCRSIRDLMPLHVGGDLDPSQARRVDEHLHDCLTCFREYRGLATMRGRLGVLAEQPLPAAALDDFTEQVMARIALGEPGPAAELPGVRVRRTIPLRPMAAAASLLVALSLGLALGVRFGPPSARGDGGAVPDELAAPPSAAPVAAVDPPAQDPTPVLWMGEGAPGAGPSLHQLGVRVGDLSTSSPAGVSLAPDGLRRAPMRMLPVGELGLPSISTRDRQFMEALAPSLRTLMLRGSSNGLVPDSDPDARLRPRRPGLEGDG